MEEIGSMIRDGWMVKAMCALADTVLIYALAYWIRKSFHLKRGEEFQL